jgi:hypothetical protein
MRTNWGLHVFLPEYILFSFLDDVFGAVMDCDRSSSKS